jgi:hypothetical protein
VVPRKKLMIEYVLTASNVFLLCVIPALSNNYIEQEGIGISGHWLSYFAIMGKSS